MRKVLPEPSLLQNVPCSLVHLAARRPRLHRTHRGFLGLEYRLVGSMLLPIRIADVHGTRHIGAITIEDNTEVQRYESLARQLRLRRVAVRKRRPRSRRDDRLE